MYAVLKAWWIYTMALNRVEKGVFQFKQFAVRHDRCAMKVGTDGVLLGAWALIGKGEEFFRVLDVGSGSGLIALQLAQRFDRAAVLGLEIDPAAAEQAQENFESSPWSNRLSMLRHDARDFASEAGFDALITNPPFYQENVSSADPSRDQARQLSSLPFEALFGLADRSLKDGGRLALVSPASEEEWIRSLARKAGFGLRRFCRVRGHSTARVKRLLWEFVKASEDAFEEEELTLEVSRGEYTEEYRALVASFYLKM